MDPQVSACVFAFVFTPLPILLGSCELPDPPGKHYEEETGPVNRQARERAEKEIEQLKAERDAKIISIKSLEAGLIGKDEKIARLVTEVTDREQKIAKLMDEVDNLRSSTAVEPPPDPPAKV